MKKTASILLLSLLVAGCGKSLQDQAEEQAREYTRKYCPTPVKQYERMDSMTFDRQTNTFTYWKSLFGEADRADVVEKNRDRFHEALLKAVSEDTRNRVFKDEGFRFRFVYHSGSKPQQVLLDYTFTQKDY